jgi:hypothetical protein
MVQNKNKNIDYFWVMKEIDMEKIGK